PDSSRAQGGRRGPPLPGPGGQVGGPGRRRRRTARSRAAGTGDEADTKCQKRRMTMVDARHLTREELEAGVDESRRSPRDEGVLALIVRRPQVGEREVLGEGHLDLAEGLAGDSWRVRGSSRSADGSSHPDMQLNIMNSRVIALVAQHRDRWQLAGD